MEDRAIELTSEELDELGRSGQLGDICVHGDNAHDGPYYEMLCYYTQEYDDLIWGFVYYKNTTDGYECRSPLLSACSLVSHNPYWDPVDTPPSQAELRRMASLPQDENYPPTRISAPHTAEPEEATA